MKYLLSSSTALVLMSRGMMSADDSLGGAPTYAPPATAASFTPTPVQSSEELSQAMTTAIETAVLAAVGSKFGFVGTAVAKMLIGQVVEPLIGALMTVVQHIGMAVPHALGELVEKLESGVGFDLNGDGFVGDPDDKE